MLEGETKTGLLRRMARSRYFKREAPLTSIKEIVLWWESRRTPYNLIVGISGLVTCAVFIVCGTIVSIYGNPEENLLMPDGLLLPLAGVLLYAVAANILYTGGWVVEALLHALGSKAGFEIGPLTFMLGLIFSVALTLLPALFAVGLALVSLTSPAP